MTWERGRAAVERLLTTGELEAVTPSEDVASKLLSDASAHLSLARRGLEDDPVGALQLSYDCARKSAAALLAVQGLRSTSRGGHIAVIEAVRAQFDGAGASDVFGKLNRLRRRRHAAEYPAADSPDVTADDARHALDVASDALDAATRMIEAAALSPFR